jgi:hypothetical protein
MADDEDRTGNEAAAQRPDPAGVAARSMTQLAQQMREMADRMLTGGLPGWPLPGVPTGSTGAGSGGSASTSSVSGGSGSGGSGSGGSGSGGRSAAAPGLPAVPGAPRMPGLPTGPATMSARQLQAVVDDIAARRSQVQALVTQLTAFDEQLAGLETSLQPLLQWLRTWSDLEGSVTDFWTPRPPTS